MKTKHISRLSFVFAYTNSLASIIATHTDNVEVHTIRRATEPTITNPMRMSSTTSADLSLIHI